MTSTYAASAKLYGKMLTNLIACFDKAIAYAGERKFDPDILVTARLAPDMRPLSFQVQSATDQVKGSLSRLTGREIPSWADSETTMVELKARLQKAIDFAAGFSEADLAEAHTRMVQIKIGGVLTDLNGEAYLLQRVLPNFFFHVTTAYDILRHNGVPVGKGDFLGPVA